MTGMTYPPLFTDRALRHKVLRQVALTATALSFLDYEQASKRIGAWSFVAEG